MDYMGHNPPHFHARYGEYDISVSIRDSRVLAGGLPKSKERILFKWAEEQRQELMTRRDDAQHGREISPLTTWTRVKPKLGGIHYYRCRLF